MDNREAAEEHAKLIAHDTLGTVNIWRHKADNIYAVLPVEATAEVVARWRETWRLVAQARWRHRDSSVEVEDV
jgi:hypothetical protein